MSPRTTHIAVAAVLTAGLLAFAASGPLAQAAESAPVTAPLTQMLSAVTGHSSDAATTGAAKTDPADGETAPKTSGAAKPTTGSAEGGSSEGEGAEPAKKTKVAIALSDADQSLVMPYGVDPVSWANDTLTFKVTVTGEDGKATTSEVSAKDLGRTYFQDGAAPLVAVDQAAYPVRRLDADGNRIVHPDWTKTLTFAGLAKNDALDVSLPADLGGLAAQVSWSYDGDGSEDSLPLAPSRSSTPSRASSPTARMPRSPAPARGRARTSRSG